jgi:hypothetical protein
MYAMVGPASSRLSPEWLAFERRHEENYAGRDRAHPYQNKKPHLAEGYTLSLILNSHTYVNRGPLGHLGHWGPQGAAPGRAVGSVFFRRRLPSSRMVEGISQ